MGETPSYELLTWASRHLNPDEFDEAKKYLPGQIPARGEYLDAETGALVIVDGGERVPPGTVYLSIASLSEHGVYSL